METRRQFVGRAASGAGYAAIVATTALIVGSAVALLEAWRPW
ncbi:hypothetical protein [Catenuloplanes indicus]|uniref:Uncharacterized protein n=1 Tax=Catenuloplanes indicus TaxID=137267 RepID=A0AAE3VW08_9ACTN|nr:hypothetical protein [Catenuloplanes indicus]MDQ0364632.1 hypothetical protein [Catenuloplanes indicus]